MWTPTCRRPSAAGARAWCSPASQLIQRDAGPGRWSYLLELGFGPGAPARESRLLPLGRCPGPIACLSMGAAHRAAACWCLA